MNVPNKLKMHCNKCGHEWLETLPLPMIIAAFSKRMKALCCPSCAAGLKALDILT